MPVVTRSMTKRMDAESSNDDVKRIKLLLQNVSETVDQTTKIKFVIEIYEILNKDITRFHKWPLFMAVVYNKSFELTYDLIHKTKPDVDASLIKRTHSELLKAKCSIKTFLIELRMYHSYVESQNNHYRDAYISIDNEQKLEK